MSFSIFVLCTIGVYLVSLMTSRFLIYKLISKGKAAVILFFLFVGGVATASDVGVYYFPGWDSKNRNWNDLKGLADSRSPNVPWPDREPLLGYYAEEDIKVAEQHIDWARQYGITFFSYDWYWDGKTTSFNHAIDNFLKASNRSMFKFSLLWANHSDVPRNIDEFDDMITYWLKNYLRHPQYYRVHGKPIVFIFSNSQLEINAKTFGWTSVKLLKRANEFAQNVGVPEIYFVAITNAKPGNEMESYLLGQGFSAYSGWNYVQEKDKSQSADYQSMVDTYLDFYAAAKDTKGVLPYIVPASPGWDNSPWQGSNAVVRNNSTPEKFMQMLTGAKEFLNSQKSGILDIVMIEAWNEFCEGAYIEPTKKFDFQYLQMVKKVFDKYDSEILNEKHMQN
jgi:hypothetical protein